MAKPTMQLHDVAPQSESINDALELAWQTAATTQPNSMPTPTDDRWLAAYGDQWRSHQMEGLELRWQLGTCCNAALGGPRASNDIASRIGCALPDLHLMMWFARRVPDLHAFLDQHPGVTSWGKAKEVVAQLSPNRGTRKRSVFGKLIGMIRKLTSEHQKGTLAFEKQEVNKLSTTLLRFTLALEKSSSPADATVADIE